MAEQVSTKKYFKDTVAELKKVIWPTKQDITNNTAAVIGAVVVIGLFIWVFDWGLDYLVRTLLTHTK